MEKTTRDCGGCHWTGVLPRSEPTDPRIEVCVHPDVPLLSLRTDTRAEDGACGPERRLFLPKQPNPPIGHRTVEPR